MKAIAVFTGTKIKGTVIFTQEIPGKVTIDINISGLKKNHQHGFHIHEYGDMSEGCESMGGHYNPYNKNHGGQDSKERHVGDLGNIQTDSEGCAQYQMIDRCIKLLGTKNNIFGRGLVIHTDTDDCGKGTNASSLVNGNSGKRIACAIICRKHE